jgi:hypothetical protein
MSSSRPVRFIEQKRIIGRIGFQVEPQEGALPALESVTD